MCVVFLLLILCVCVCEMCVLGIIAFISHVLIVGPEARGQIVGGQAGVAELPSKYGRKIL